jgi:hypothetical protein
MKIQNYLSSLLPSFGKDRIIEDVRLTKTEIKDVTHPSYEAALPLLKNWKFKSSKIKDHAQTFDRVVKKVKSGNMIVAIEAAFKPMIENLDAAENLIVKTYSEDVAGAGLTYLKANLLQFVECTGFVSKYARKFLLYIYICETAEYGEDGGTIIGESLSKAEIEWLDSNMVSFCTALSIVSGNPAHVKKSIEDVPDILVTTENIHTLGATVGEAKLDPFQMKLIPIWMNPIYHVGMFVAEWQASRYKASKEEVKLIELRKLNLIKLSENKPDAHLQQQITYMETRIQGLNYQIAQMEKKNGA